MSVNQFKPGDLVTGYHKGYWIVTHTTRRIVHYQRIDAKGKVFKSCDSSYCKLIDPEVLRANMIDEADLVYSMLLKALH